MRLRVCASLCLMAGLAGLALFGTACGGSGNNKTQIRLLHAMVLYTDLNMLVGSSTVASNISYGTASSYAAVSSGTQTVQIEQSGSSSPLVNASVSLGSGTSTTALAYLDTSDNPQGSFLTDNNAAPTSGNFNLRIINASPAIGVGGADVYVVVSGSGINGSPTLSASSSQGGTQDNGLASGYISLAAGTYDIYFTVPGTKEPIATDTGVAFSAGQVRTAVALNAVSGGVTVAVIADAG